MTIRRLMVILGCLAVMAGIALVATAVSQRPPETQRKVIVKPAGEQFGAEPARE